MLQKEQDLCKRICVGLVFMYVYKIQLRKWATQIIKTIQEQINSNTVIIYPITSYIQYVVYADI